MKRSVRWVCLTALLLLCEMVFAQSSQSRNILFIIDASGSMWGKIGNSAKIEIAKATMDKLSRQFTPSSNIGLIAYGHRSQSDCKDIETLIPMGPANRESFMTKIKSLNPKGKTPIALSISHALSLTKDITEPVTLILVSDGLETCEGNACSILSAARTAGMKVTVHVVGFGINEKDLSPLECLAQAGGGQYFPASNAEELAAALETTVKQQPAGDAFLSVKTILQGKLKDATVKVFKKGQARELRFGRTYESKETNPRIMQLEAGEYSIEVLPVGIQNYPVARLSDIVIKSGDTLSREIEFEQGVVEVLVTRNGELSDATVQIFQTGTKTAVSTTRSYNRPTHNPAKLKVPPGVYDIVLSSVEIGGRPQVTILKKELGNAGNLQLSHNFESGELSIGARQGSQLVDATVSVINVKTGKNADAGRTYQSASSNPKKFILEPGQYRVDLNPVRPAGLGKKSITLELKAKGTIEQIIEW